MTDEEENLEWFKAFISIMLGCVFIFGIIYWWYGFEQAKESSMLGFVIGAIAAWWDINKKKRKKEDEKKRAQDKKESSENGR